VGWGGEGAVPACGVGAGRPRRRRRMCPRESIRGCGKAGAPSSLAASLAPVQRRPPERSFAGQLGRVWARTCGHDDDAAVG
jgi:hypothetical protein